MSKAVPASTICLLLAIAFPGGPALGALVLEGRIYDGPASNSRVRTEGLRSATWKVPVAGREIEIRALRPGAEKSWKTTTGPDGGFRVETNLSNFREASPLVALVDGDGRQFFTGSFNLEEKKPLEIFAYPAGEDPGRVRTIAKVVHSIEKEGGFRYLKVQFRVEFLNGGDSIYIGQKSRDGSREVYRIPIPAGAVLRRNEGPVPGTRWKKSPDGRFLIIDEPVQGFADLLARGHQPGVDGPGWLVEYRLPATNLFTLTYPQTLRPLSRQEGQGDGFLVFVQDGDMKIEPTVSSLQKFNDTVKTNPLAQTSKSFDVYGTRPDAAPEAGALLRVSIELSDMAIGEMSEDALFWHGGTIAVILLGILAGIALGRSRAPAISLEGLTGGQSSPGILDQIASIDALRASGGIAEGEYQRQREVLVELAAGELESGKAGSESGAPAAIFSTNTRKVLARIAELDEKTEAGIEDVQERAHLLESLYKSLRNDLEA